MTYPLIYKFKSTDGRELNIVVHQTVPGVRSLPELDSMI